MHKDQEPAACRIFPYKCRSGQRDFLLEAERAQGLSRHVIWEGPTGTGKTICGLSAALSFAGAARKVLYLTRTNSQQTQVLREAKAISEKQPLAACGMQGRQRWCPLSAGDPSFSGGSPEELSRLCGRKKKLTRDGGGGGCPYYVAFINMDRGAFLEFSKSTPSPEDFARKMVSAGVCPYEAVKEVLPLANVVAAPYIFFFKPSVSRTILENMRCSPENLVVVVDEAHNIPEYVRDIASASLSLESIGRALREAEEYSDAPMPGGLKPSMICRAAEHAVSTLVEQYCGSEEDSLLPCADFSAEMMSFLQSTSTTLKQACVDMILLGEQIKLDRLDRGKLPRSYMHSLACFIGLWDNIDGENYVHLASAKPPSIEAYCLDPKDTAEELSKISWSLHMSGTLRPLEQYRDTLGLKDAVLHASSSPFPPDNRVVLIAEDVTTKHEDWADEGNRLRMCHYIRKIMDMGLNTGFFFPSFSIMDQCLSLCGIGQEVFVEKRNTPQDELMNALGEFKASGGTLFGVSGGRLSEGIDFPGRDLEVVVVAGLPYPYPSAKQKALIRYYDILMDRGWEYAMNAPMERKTLQALGRLIRGEEERGVAVILDYRARKLSHLLGHWETVSSPEQLKRKGIAFMNG